MEKENGSEADEDDDERSKKAKKKKTVSPSLCTHVDYISKSDTGIIQKRIDPATLPGNVALTAKIGELRNRWRCNDKTCRNGSDYCYVGGHLVEHYPLSHAHIDVWASAIVSLCHLSFESDVPKYISTMTSSSPTIRQQSHHLQTITNLEVFTLPP
jgi:hypothetical protein